jgi:hypothetical protein
MRSGHASQLLGGQRQATRVKATVSYHGIVGGGQPYAQTSCEKGVDEESQERAHGVSSGHLRLLWSYGPASHETGAVEKSRQPRSRQFSVLTYWKYALRAKLAAALLDELF